MSTIFHWRGAANHPSRTATGRLWRPVAAALFAAMAVSGPAQAQSTAYPDRPINLIIPFPPGAGTDAMGRLMATKLADTLKATVTAENKTGASGAIGARLVAQSAPDGYTLLLVVSPFTTTAASLPEAGYDPITQFTSVAMIATGPLVWAANVNVPARNMSELLDYARANPGKLNYGSAGSGSINHLVLELLQHKSGVKITHVPYKGIADANRDMLAGQIHLVTGTIPALLPLIKEGRVKALAVTAARRTSALPDVLNMSESGLKGFDVLNYYGIMAPRGTAQPVVAKLNTAINSIIALPDVKERFNRDAIEATPGEPEQLSKFVAADYDAWKAMVKATNLKIDP